MTNNADPFHADIISRWQLCRFCRHLYHLMDRLKCAAFPEGIPQEITSGDFLHNQPLPGQENGLVFKPW